MKKFVACSLLFLGTIAAAAPVVLTPTIPDADGSTGMIVPSFATGFVLHHTFKIDAQGSVIVCTKRNAFSNECETWKTMEQAVPNGKVYVGFKVVPYGSARQIEIYFK